MGDLTERQQEIVRLRYAHVQEVETGFRSGDPWRALPGEPCAVYDPLATTVAQRRAAKVAELAASGADEAALLGFARVSVRTLQRYAVACRRLGMLGCVDGNSPAVSNLDPAACRNPTGERRVCGWRLDTTPTSPTSDQNLPALLALQHQLLHRIRTDEPVTSAGLPATPAQYFIGLRILACLITVSWPAAQHLLNNHCQADHIDTHANATRRRVEQIRRDAPLARDHALYDTPPTDTATCAALLSLADSITHANNPDHARDLLGPLLRTVPETHRNWIKQFLHGQGVSSPGLRTTLGPAIGAAHIAANTGLAPRTTDKLRASTKTTR